MTPNLKLREIVEANRVGDFWATRQIEKVARVFAKWALEEAVQIVEGHDAPIARRKIRALAAKLDGGEE